MWSAAFVTGFLGKKFDFIIGARMLLFGQIFGHDQIGTSQELRFNSRQCFRLDLIKRHLAVVWVVIDMIKGHI